KRGKRGKDGKDGKRGKDGIPGEDGPTGPTGPAGDSYLNWNWITTDQVTVESKSSLINEGDSGWTQSAWTDLNYPAPSASFRPQEGNKNVIFGFDLFQGPFTSEFSIKYSW